jgi:hypothetical protein
VYWQKAVKGIYDRVKKKHRRKKEKEKSSET